MKMKNEFTLWNFTLFLLCFIYTIVNVVVVVNCQRSSKKLDVYIAGFFPYREGVEKSETGKKFYFPFDFLLYTTILFQIKRININNLITLSHDTSCSHKINSKFCF